jgi:hypothetical protein
MQRAEGATVVLMGDERQNIYNFRAARNYIDQCLQFEESRVYALTKSFRFPQPIADLASDIHIEWKGDDVRISGLGKRNRPRSHAFIARTNSTILGHAQRPDRQRTKGHSFCRDRGARTFQAGRKVRF